MKKILISVSALTVAVISMLAFTLRDAVVYAATVGTYQLASVNNSGDGQGGNNTSADPIMSANGRYVMFNSTASNLVPNDMNGVRDVFVRDTKLGTTVRASISSTGVEPNMASGRNAISRTGRYVLYTSSSTNLEGSTTGSSTYLHDMTTGSNKFIFRNTGSSLKFGGISSDGKYITATFTTGDVPLGPNYENPRAFVYDVTAGTWSRMALPTDGVETTQWQSEISSSCDAALTAFTSNEDALVSGDTNGTTDVFLADIRHHNSVINITQGFDYPSTEPKISCNGDYVTFKTSASNIPGVPTTTGYHYYRYDVVNGTYALVDQDTNGHVFYAPTLWKVTDDGKVLFDAKYTSDPFSPNRYGIRDADNQTTELITGSNVYRPADMDKDGKKFVITSILTTLIPSDTNGYMDVFTSQIN